MKGVAAEVVDEGISVLMDCDLQVIGDLTEGADGGPMPCYYIGQHTELAAGLRGFSVDNAPTFKTIDEAYEWAAQNKTRLYHEYLEPYQ